MIVWYKQKTTWTIIAAMVAAVGGYLMGEMTVKAMVETIFLGMTGIFLRQGVEKSRPSDVPIVVPEKKPEVPDEDHSS